MTTKRTSGKAAKAKPAKTIRKKAESEKPVPTATTKAVLEGRSGKDRRDTDRRKQAQPVAVERRQGERRVKVSRRRQIDPTTCERDYSPEEIEFMGALDDYKRRSGRMFPTCSEVLEVLRGLGYMKSQPTPTTPAETPAAAEPAAAI